MLFVRKSESITVENALPTVENRASKNISVKTCVLMLKVFTMYRSVNKLDIQPIILKAQEVQRI
jgi:hypothetical protein